MESNPFKTPLDTPPQDPFRDPSPFPRADTANAKGSKGFTSPGKMSNDSLGSVDPFVDADEILDINEILDADEILDTDYLQTRPPAQRRRYLRMLFRNTADHTSSLIFDASDVASELENEKRTAKKPSAGTDVKSKACASNKGWKE
jgi:hypothetical protein